MKIVFISDTHELHHQLMELPSADMIIHAGDISMKGGADEVEAFIEWFTALDYKYKIFIAGNHDFCFENKSIDKVQNLLRENVYYLCDSAVTIEGITIHGSPVTPQFFDLAFNRQRGEEIRRHWLLIPDNTDILITHGAPYGILDKTVRGTFTGCEDLLDVISTIKPKYHLFGHIHEAYGVHKTEHTTFINGSVLNEKYELSNSSIVFEI